MAFNTKDCEWKSVEINVLGRKFTGLRGYEFNKETDTEYIYGSGDKPIDITEGNKGFPGTLTLLKYEVDLMNDAAQVAGYNDITEVPYEAIVITVHFVPRGGGQRRFVVCPGVKFTSLKFTQNQGDKFMEIALPLLSMDLKTGFL